jgi:4a-hydroxytetrahydrobiopterin dehydratase
MNQKLMEKKCQVCEVGGAALTEPDISILMKELGGGWEVRDDGKMIAKTFSFPDFKQTMTFVNKVADLAEEEGHHPDMRVSWGKAVIELSTHAVKGLSENDFILAAKIDQL